MIELTMERDFLEVPLGDWIATLAALRMAVTRMHKTNLGRQDNNKTSFVIDNIF
jgi:hypothetical protein